MELTDYIKSKHPEFNDLHINSIVLRKADYSISIYFKSKCVYSDEQKAKIKNCISEVVPQSFKVGGIEYSKIYCDREIAISSAKKILESLSPSLYSAVFNCECDYNDGDGVYILNFDIYENVKIADFNCGGIFDKLVAELSERFFERFTYSIKYIPDDRLQNEETAENAASFTEAPENIECRPSEERYIKVKDVAPLIGKLTDDRAFYIEDCEYECQTVICGKIGDFSERQTKNGKILISFTLEDFTGKISCIMFPSATNYPKAKKLCNDTAVILKGELKKDTYRNNTLTCMVRHISFCELPADFVYTQKASKKEPANYTAVIPQKLELTSQVNIFDNGDSAVSDFFKGKKFVVFDVETTGLNYDIDKITEIGAILIDDGKITMSFSTLINPQMHIKEDTVRLNGIDDELVKDSPIIENVLPDFYKFTRGCYLVAQNIEFDIKFIKYNAAKTGYFFENGVYDTLEIARNKLAGRGLTNYRLETLCEYFNIDLKDHHRAWNDALATAKLFIKLINLND